MNFISFRGDMTRNAFQKVCLLIILLFTSAMSSAQTLTYQWVEVFDDLSIQDLSALPKSRWQTMTTEKNLNKGFSDGAFWVRLELPPKSFNQMLEIAYPLLDEVSIYWEVAGQVIETHHTGDALPFNSRPIYHRNFVFPVPSVDEKLIAWIKVRTSGSVQIPITVSSSIQFLADEQVGFGWQAMFFGIVAALALYNLILFAIVRQTTYLWYVLTVLITSLVQLNFKGLLFQFLWPNVPILNQYFTVSAVGAALFFALSFTMSFLSVRQFSIGGDRLLRGLRYMALLLIGYGLFGSYQLGIVVVSGFAALVTPAAWVVGLLVWRRGQVLAGFYVLAWTLLLLAHLALAVSKLGWVPIGAFTELAPQAGVALEAILLSFALAYRINIERQKRQQAQALALQTQREANLMLEARVLERTEELQKVNDKLKAVSLTDGLTQVANRRRFDEKLDEEWTRLIRSEQELSLIIIDIDYFKEVNDTFGHLVGDDCLVAVSNLINNEIKRSEDLLARYGGEEFAVLLPTTTSDEAMLIAERIRQAVELSPITTSQDIAPIKLTISLGVATLIPDQNARCQNLIKFADEALYGAKASGRNRVVMAKYEK
jgi:diguanylate cyclase (GGDEF)-like protein